MDRDSHLALEGDGLVYAGSDDTELLLSAVVVEPGERFLEVGTGEGLVALHASLWTNVVATDVNPAAVRLTARNAAKNRLAIGTVRCDLMSAIRGPFDVIAFNPPYLEGDSVDDLERAWAGGRDGSAVALRFLEDLSRVLAVDGRAYLLLADHDEAARAFAQSHFTVRVAASTRLFFEKLEVLEIRRRDR